MQKNHTATLTLRRCLLTQLYDLFREMPLAPVELRHLAQCCQTDAHALNWNIVYMEKKGWVTLSHDTDCPPYASCYVELTGVGIDLVENESALEKEFPDNQKKQYESIASLKE